MYSQFEKQYSDFLRTHLTHLAVADNRASEEEILEHINHHISSCSATDDQTTEQTIFNPTLIKSFKSDDLAKEHVCFAEELLGASNLELALGELCEAIKNVATSETLVHVISTRIIVLSQLNLLHELKSDLKLLRTICCSDCLKSVFQSNVRHKLRSGEDAHYFSCILDKFGIAEHCNLEKTRKHRIKEINSSVEASPDDDDDVTCSHNLPRTCSTPTLDTSLSEEYSHVASSVKILQSEERGRFAVAEKDLQIGEVIAVEEANVWTVLPDKWSLHCQLCLNLCRAPFPCLDCPDVVFCSIQCLQNDHIHRVECGYMPELQTLPKMVYLAFRTVRTFQKDIVSHSRGEETSRNFRQLHNLITNFELRSPVDITRRSTLAIFLTNVIKTLNVFKSCKNDTFFNRSDIGLQFDFSDDEHTALTCRGPADPRCTISVGDVTICVGGHCHEGCHEGLDYKKIYRTTQWVLLKCLQSYPCNAHEISELQIKRDFRYSVNEDIGAGAYPFLSLINHSCNPNVVRHSVGKSTVLRVLRKITAGSELLDNYGYHYATHGPTERRKALRSQYLFECACVPCKDKRAWPLFGEVPTNIRFRCSDCDSLIPESRCVKCGRNLSKIIQKINNLAKDCQNFIQKFVKDGGTVPMEPSSILKFLKMCEIHTVLPSRLHNECQEVMKQIWNLRSNTRTPLGTVGI